VLVAERTQRTTLALVLSGLFVAGAFLPMARATRARRKSELALSTKHAETTLLLRMGELLQATLSSMKAYQVSDSSAPRSRWGNYAADGDHALQFVPDHCWSLRCGKQHSFDANGPRVRCRHTPQTDLPNSLCLPPNSRTPGDCRRSNLSRPT